MSKLYIRTVVILKWRHAEKDIDEDFFDKLLMESLFKMLYSLAVGSKIIDSADRKKIKFNVLNINNRQPKFCTRHVQNI